MHLQHCRAAAPALSRPRAHDITILQHTVRSFHISTRRNDESSTSGSNSSPVPGNSARARSQLASQRIQSLNTTVQYKQVGLAGGSFPSGQTAPPRRIIQPVRRPTDSSSAPSTGPRLQTPRIQTRVLDRAAPRYPNSSSGGNRRPGGGYGGPRAGGAAGGPRGRPGYGPARRRNNRVGGGRGRSGDKKDDGGQGGQLKLSDTVLRYLLSLKAARRAVKTHTPRDPSKEDLVAQSALSASLGQPGGATALLEQRLRALAERAEMEPVPLLAQARRLVRGQFVKFADEKERDAVMALVAQHQADIAARLSEKKGEAIAPKAIEFEELGQDVRQKTTDAVVAGRYAVHARAVEPPKEGVAAVPASSRDVAAKMLDLNGSYVGEVREKFMGRLQAIMGVQGPAASKGIQQRKAKA
ncbi:hypothetical protein B0J12DRAFT_725474 [Macrophomina phaseolina]|uniref:Altered inheritance of mitochondria protein 41 n=1 Tax=Macrophomina phaseolina TaxID=35725 RepID=A0ABQ8GMA2_9PEZI|nr:hypothetical protein B0J12DRAFT_725474 [Macrophomina phaseolina]